MPPVAPPLPLFPPAVPKKTGSGSCRVSVAAHAPNNNDTARTRTRAGEAIPVTDKSVIFSGINVSNRRFISGICDLSRLGGVVGEIPELFHNPFQRIMFTSDQYSSILFFFTRLFLQRYDCQSAQILPQPGLDHDILVTFWLLPKKK